MYDKTQSAVFHASFHDRGEPALCGACEIRTAADNLRPGTVFVGLVETEPVLVSAHDKVHARAVQNRTP